MTQLAPAHGRVPGLRSCGCGEPRMDRAADRTHLQGMEGEAGMESESSRTDRIGGGSARAPHRWTRVDDPQAEAVVAAHATVIAGGGPAGLTAAYELTKHGHSCVVLEADPHLVGGISRTDQYKGYRFDIGGHRFFSKSEEVNRLWHDILGDQFIVRSRLSRIYYKRRFFPYPLKPANALLNLGPFTSAMVLASYVKAR